MKELSLNILDIAQNSIKANAAHVEIALEQRGDWLTITITDDGTGMSPEFAQEAANPFTTTRTTRKVGMGLPLFKLAAEQTGGSLCIESEVGIGTKVKAIFKTDSIDYTPLGDIDSTVIMLVTMNTDRNFIFRLKVDEKEFTLSTSELKGILGDVPLNEPSVTQWIKEYLHEQTQTIRGGVL